MALPPHQLRPALIAAAEERIDAAITIASSVPVCVSLRGIELDGPEKDVLIRKYEAAGWFRVDFGIGGSGLFAELKLR